MHISWAMYRTFVLYVRSLFDIKCSKQFIHSTGVTEYIINNAEYSRARKNNKNIKGLHYNWK